MKKPSLPIGFGTAAIGRPQYINIRKEVAPRFSLELFRQKGIDMLEAAYQHGIRYFDTAPGYGLAEELLIDWVKQKEDASIEIATKWGYTYVANFNPNAIQHEVKEHSLAKLNEQWQQSVNLFPHLTTYQIHSATLETGVLDNEKILHRLAALKNEYGLYVGITTTGSNQAEVLKKALDIEVGGVALFDIFQVTYNVFDQSLADLAKEISTQNKRLVIKEALANGRVFPNDKYDHYRHSYQILKSLAEKYRVGVDAIALRFCIDSIDTYQVLSGASNEIQLLENLKITELELTEREVTLLKGLAVRPEEYWSERKQLAWN